MLRSTHDLKNVAVGATDGEIDYVNDFYFADERWVVRYLVVETGDLAVRSPNRAEKIMPVSITREQVKCSPDIDTDRPVSRQHESSLSPSWAK